MASIDVFEERVYANVSAAVGSARAANQQDDVMVVQALLMTVCVHSKWNDPKELSAPTGTFDAKTAKAILDFQRYAQEDLYGKREFISQDGRISPALGRRRWGYNALWTIVALNDAARFHLANAGIEIEPADYIRAAWPQIASALENPRQ